MIWRYQELIGNHVLHLFVTELAGYLFCNHILDATMQLLISFDCKILTLLVLLVTVAQLLVD